MDQFVDHAVPLCALDAPQCPICGQPNACAAAKAGGFEQPCWCASVQFSADVLSRVPQDQRGKACVCSACAQGAAAEQKPLSP